MENENNVQGSKFCNNFYVSLTKAGDEFQIEMVYINPKDPAAKPLIVGRFTITPAIALSLADGIKEIFKTHNAERLKDKTENSKLN